MVMVNRAVHPGCPAGGKRVGFTCNTVEEAVEWQHAMVEAIEAYVAAHPDTGKDAAGQSYDAYDIERQVAGPGGMVIATVAASAGTQYTDLAVTMRRSDAGEWSVSKIERGA